MESVKKFFLYLCQLPQNLLGKIFVVISKASFHEWKGNNLTVKYYVTNRFNNGWSGVSLGDYILLSKERYVTEVNLKHEHGHQVQSKSLGWFYLVLIGIPSVIANLLHRKIKFNYYRTPWEASADRLGGVVRR